MQAIPELIGQHGGAVVSHERARQRPAHQRLAESVHQASCGLVPIPLRMTDQPRAIVEHTQRDRLDPLALRGQHVARALMEIKMPENAVHRILWRMRSHALC